MPTARRVARPVLAIGLFRSGVVLAAAGRYLAGASAAQDTLGIAAVLVVVESGCPCARAASHRRYVG